jgi:hypothetical protein
MRSRLSYKAVSTHNIWWLDNECPWALRHEFTGARIIIIIISVLGSTVTH